MNRVPLGDWQKDLKVLSLPQPQASCIRSQLLRCINVSSETTKEFQFSFGGKWLVLRASEAYDKDIESLCLQLWPAMPERKNLPSQQILALVHVAMILPANDDRIRKDPFVKSDHWIWILDRVLPLKRISHVLNCDPLEPASHWLKRKISKQLQLTRLNEKEMQKLAQSFLLHLLPEAAKTQQDAPAKTPTEKKFRMEKPPKEELKALRNLLQNTPEWLEARKKSKGSSDLGDICGVTSFRHNVHIWQSDMGLVAEDERLKEEFFCFDHGHFFQDSIFTDSPEHAIYCIVMKCRGRNVGIIIHPKYPYNHTSLDGMVHHDKHVHYNLYTLEDWPWGTMEIKMMIYQIPCGQDHGKHGIMHKISPAHAIQMMNQLDCGRRPKESIAHPMVCSFLAGFLPPRHNDYAASWRMNEKKAPDEIKSSWHKLLLRVGASFFSRVYFHADFADIVQHYLKNHVNAVITKTLPKRYDRVKLPFFAFVPLKHMYWYVHFEDALDPNLTQPFSFVAKGKTYQTIVQVWTGSLSEKQQKDVSTNMYLKELTPKELKISVVLHHYWDCPILEYTMG